MNKSQENQIYNNEILDEPNEYPNDEEENSDIQLNEYEKSLIEI